MSTCPIEIAHCEAVGSRNPHSGEFSVGTWTFGVKLIYSTQNTRFIGFRMSSFLWNTFSADIVLRKLVF